MNSIIARGIIDVLDMMGIVIGEEEFEDLDLREYVIDSLQFITFILELEHYFSIEIPADILVYDNISSFNGFSELLVELVEENSIETK